MGTFCAWVTAPFLGCLLCAPISAQVTERVSVDSGGVQGNGDCEFPSVSGDGRFVVFQSYATNLVLGDTNGVRDIFVRDRQVGTTERVSVDSSGTEANDSSGGSPAISDDGRYVVFSSGATNLVPGDTNGEWDVFVRNRQSGTTERVSVDSAGVQGNGGSTVTSISADGRYVAFDSDATNLVLGDTNLASDAFVRDRQSNTTERVSVDSGGGQGNSNSHAPFVSTDGRFVVFWSYATNFVPGDTNVTSDTFVRDRQSGTTERVNVDSAGMQGNSNSFYGSISADGRYVAFVSLASNLVPADTNGHSDIFVCDRQSGTTERVSVDSASVPGNSDSGSFPSSISADGRYVAFYGDATNLVPGDTNGASDVFVHDRQSGTTERVSVDSGGAEGNFHNLLSSISADGRYVAFESAATNLVPGDTNGVWDVFVRDRGLAPPFSVTPFCFGDGLSVQCPCNNPGAPGHGCENSTGTGGAILGWIGDALLSNDTRRLISSDERQTAFSLFWQGDVGITPRVFGDGLGCMGGHLKRLFFHNAVGGAVTAPQGADLSLSARSAAVGNPISPGTTRVYHAFYRDPDLDFCPWPQGSTFNVTSGLRVLWGS